MDTGLLVAVCCAVPLVIGVMLSTWQRRRRLGVLDVYLVGMAIFYGAYTVVDAMYPREERFDPWIVLEVFLCIWVAALIIGAFARLGPRWLLEQISLERLRQDWIASPAWAVAGVLIGAAAFRLLALKYFAEYDIEQISQTQVADLPYWYTTSSMLALDLAFAAGLAAWGKVLATRGVRRWWWVAMVGVSALVFFGVGRRAIFSLILVWGWALIRHEPVRRRPWLTTGIFVLAIPALMAISNAYQLYRAASYQGVPVGALLEATDTDLKSLGSAALESDRTLENLEERRAMWLFNYEIADAYAKGDGSLQWGRLFLSEFPNYIPSALWPGKEVFDSETEIMQVYRLPVFDRSGNIMAYTYADFGVASMLAAPALVLLLVWAAGLVLRRTRDPFLRLTLIGMLLYQAVNIEGNYAIHAAVARQFLVIATAYVLLRWLMRTAVHVVRTAAVEASRPL